MAQGVLQGDELAAALAIERVREQYTRLLQLSRNLTILGTELLVHRKVGPAEGVSAFLYLCVFNVGYFGGVILFFRPNSGRRDDHNRGSDRSYEANSYAGNKPSF